MHRYSHIILDFDGPVCRLFADGLLGRGSRAPGIARTLHALVDDAELAARLRGLDDPVLLFRRTYEWYAARGDRDSPTVTGMRELLDRRERQAAESARSAPGAAAFIEAAVGSKRLLGIASNNCRVAIEIHLERVGLRPHFGDDIIGRPHRADLMKPSAWQLDTLVERWGAERRHCLLIGDSVSDGAAARAAGIDFWGLHRRRTGQDKLRAAGVTRFTFASLGKLAAAVPPVADATAPVPGG